MANAYGGVAKSENKSLAVRGSKLRVSKHDHARFTRGKAEMREAVAKTATLMLLVMLWGVPVFAQIEPIPVIRPQAAFLARDREVEFASNLYNEVKKPTTEEQFYRNVRLALDHGLFLHEDFYMKENIYRFFAAVNVASGIARDNKYKKRIWVRAADFDGIFPELRLDETPVPRPAIQLALQITTEHENVNGGLNFSTLRDGPSFEQVREIFGGEMTLDRSIPLEPPPPRTGPHGNEGWWYTLDTKYGKIRGFFGFNSAGFLSNFSLEEKGVRQ
ncbi:hypothetical protein NDK50_14825 [Paraburkholderia bryophila]|uniref:hypothetical protein n=1 Tax=Paraburkholderia bryophila TaxID=420952 RepID=UPI00234954F8|nr:hypothetical protein [Paraburkholderia bryophila]WCM18708.1 hypothetical protein NDK50_14825 [Paraburkholderia bryophila]